MRSFSIWPAFAVAAVLFYSIPLFSSHASIHWDLADVSYPAQKYFAENVRGGKLPQWTPDLDSGIPFLSDPQTGAWYPLHWPFFAIGISPRAMAWELAFHAFLAMAGAFLLARRLFGRGGAAAVGAFLYAGGGFFAAHSSDLPLFEAAALFPWLLWAALCALETGRLRWIGVAGMVGGFLVLAGDPAAAIVSFVAFICFALATRASSKRTAMIIPAVAVCAFLLSAIQMLPAIELHKFTAHTTSTGAPLHLKTLTTLLAADYYGVISGLYSGPDDIRQHYLYSGLLLIPLAAAGFFRREKWLVLLALLVPAVVFAASPRIGGAAPMNVWFVAALSLALAAASGVVWAIERAARPRLWLALLVLSAIDLWYWNMYKNPLVFARASFAELYGKSLPAAPGPLSRIWSPYIPLSLGPADGSLLSTGQRPAVEVTYGLELAQLDRYVDYQHAIENNSKLLNGLGVTQILDAKGQLQPNSATLGRVSVPPEVRFVPDRAAALAALATLDPAQSAVVEAPLRALSPGASSISILNYQNDFYRIRCNLAGASLVRIAVPYYPGWSAALDGNPTPVFPVDEALSGVFVPAGEHEITLQYRSTLFHLGAILSGVAMLILLVLLAFPL